MEWSGVMKKKPPRKNPHAVALGRLGGQVRSEAKKRASKENVARVGWSKAARKRSPPGAMLDVHGRDDGRRSERSDRNDSRPLRTVGYRPRRLWNQVFRDRSPLAVGLFEQNLVAVQRAGGQLSFLCACGKKSIELKTLGCCRVCYDRQYHSLRFFGGIRERVLERDRYRCRACGTRSRLVVHHRDGRNEPDLLITLCIRCHTRIHRSSGFRHWLYIAKIVA